jgi:hypothetical protein
MVDAVLVWVNPIHQGKTRALDPQLREVASPRPLGERTPRRHPEDGCKGGALPNAPPRLGAPTPLPTTVQLFRAELPQRSRRVAHASSSRTAGTGGKVSGRWRPYRVLTRQCYDRTEATGLPTEIEVPGPHSSAVQPRNYWVFEQLHLQGS